MLNPWYWHTRAEPTGSASVIVGGTEPDSRQRVVFRVRMTPDSAAIHNDYQFTNPNLRGMGFAPWTNTPYRCQEDLQFIIPAQHVVPHGFHDNLLKVMSWPWPEGDADSICFWRNLPGE